MDKKEKLVPKLRFKEFEESWTRDKLGNRVTISSGISPSLYELKQVGKIPFFKVDELNNSSKYQLESRFYAEHGKNMVSHGSIIFPKRGAAILNNKVRITAVDSFMDSNLMALKVESGNSNEFIYYFLLKEQLFRIADTSTIPQINNKHIEPYLIKVPTLPEQQKIADFLSAIDQKIQQLQRKKELLVRYKKGMMQKLFSQEIRFKPDPTEASGDEQGNDFPEWQWLGGNELFDNISNKDHNSDLPILAITQDQGAIPRDMIDYQMTVTEKSIASYKVVEVGDFVISLRTFQGGIEYSNYKGICSPAYIILRPSSESVDRSFYKFYLKTEKYIRQLQRNLEGIRDGKMISFKYFSEINLPYPSLAEQQKIANFLSTLDEKVAKVGQQIEQAQRFKKGLLQKMFV